MLQLVRDSISDSENEDDDYDISSDNDSIFGFESNVINLDK